MNTNLKILLIITAWGGLLCFNYYTHTTYKQAMLDSFKRGCMTEGGSYVLCNVMADEYVKSL